MIYIPTTFISHLSNFVDALYNAALTWYGFGGQKIIKEGEEFFGPW